jgi:Cu+-exporting ATPase
VTALDGFGENDVLALAASLEQGSEHPLASSILNATKERNLHVEPAEQFASVTGQGVRGVVAGRSVLVGNAALLESAHIDSSDLIARAAGAREQAQSAVFVAVDNRPAGVLMISDPVKPSAADAVRYLRDAHIRTVMITGDHRSTAQAVAARLGISEVEAEVLPDAKASVVRRLQSQGHAVAMAGDGVNDAPALAAADVGIAMGTGTDIAMESAGITLLRGDLRGVVRALRLSRATMRNIRQNLFFAFFYNLLGVPIAAGILYPFFGLLLSPMIASAAMTFSSVSVITNALRLRKIEL